MKRRRQTPDLKRDAKTGKFLRNNHEEGEETGSAVASLAYM